jgi:hypothetical protein
MPKTKDPDGGAGVSTAWKQLKSQRVRELAEQALPPLPRKKYGEPMRNPKLADDLDQLALNVEELKAFAHPKQTRSKSDEAELTTIAFRACEHSRDCEYHATPLSGTSTDQLERTVNLHHLVLQAIDRARPADKIVQTWRVHIVGRLERFRSELDKRWHSAELEKSLQALKEHLGAVLSSTADEVKVTEYVRRADEHSSKCLETAGHLGKAASAQLRQAVELHEQVYTQLDSRKDTNPAVGKWLCNIRERGGTFTNELTARKP